MQLNQLDELITIMACLPISAGWSLKCLQVSYCYLFDSAVTSSTLYAAGSIICMLCCGLLLEACNLFFLVFFLPFILRPMERVKHKNPSRIELRNDNKGGKGHIPEVTPHGMQFSEGPISAGDKIHLWCFLQHLQNCSLSRSFVFSFCLM